MNDTQIADRQSTSDPTVSVIMTAYNCERYVQIAIDSILTQTLVDFEFLICDDCSTDSTGEIISAVVDDRARLFRNDKNHGYLLTVNRLFSECRGEFIVFQDADDWSDPERLEKLHAELVSNPEVALCGSNIEKCGGAVGGISDYPITFEEISAALETGRTSLFCGASIMFRRDLLDEVGGYRELFDRIAAEHVDWYLRVLEHHRACNLDETLYFYRQLPNSISQTASKDLLRYYSADLALAFQLLRAHGLPEPAGLDRAAAQALVIKALHIDDAGRAQVTNSIVDQASFGRLGTALRLLYRHRYKLTAGEFLSLAVRVCATFLAVKFLPIAMLTNLAARARKRRAELIVAAMKGK